MLRRSSFLIAAIGACLAGAAPANDSTAEKAAGGLVLTRTEDIDMVAEDLFVSADRIRVRYVFRNQTPRDITTTVAFPMPERDLYAEWDGNIAEVGAFETRVDGRPVRMSVERRALLDGVDHTDLLLRLGLSLSEGPGEESGRAIAGMRAEDRARLTRLGLVAEENGTWIPRWRVRETWHWDQTFPAGRDLLVEHSYEPAAGGSVMTPLTSPDYVESDDGRAQIARHCIDAAFLSGVRRLAARTGEDLDYATIFERRVSYILTTGSNWRAPIGDFRLVVDKGAPENLVSFCGEGVRRISPTQFEVRRRNWRPRRDLDVLILAPQRSAR